MNICSCQYSRTLYNHFYTVPRVFPTLFFSENIGWPGPIVLLSRFSRAQNGKTAGKVCSLYPRFSKKKFSIPGVNYDIKNLFALREVLCVSSFKHVCSLTSCDADGVSFL